MVIDLARRCMVVDLASWCIHGSYAQLALQVSAGRAVELTGVGARMAVDLAGWCTCSS
jgi:hypothetical protein